MSVSGAVPVRKSRGILWRETLAFALETFRVNRFRFVLTALGMAIGSASLILVVTIGLAGKRFVLNSIQNIGTNLIWAEYTGLTSAGTTAFHDYLTVDDMTAVEEQVPGVTAATPVVNMHQNYSGAGGITLDLLILGVNPEYQDIRRLLLLSGRFFDRQDALQHSKVAVVTEKFAISQYGSDDEALGRTITISSLPFTIIGTFRERMETYGQSEIVDDTILIPYTVARYMTGTDAVNQIYFSTADTASVPWVTQAIRKIIKGRHRPESVYDVGNLTQVLAVAGNTATAFSIILLLFSMVTLVVSGVGIMNIMLANVRSRTREIGLRKAIGATFYEIEGQFLLEAMLISLTGGVAGTVLGMAVPLSINFFSNYRVQVSWLAAVLAIVVSCVVGITFGTVPAVRAARLDPAESLRFE